MTLGWLKSFMHAASFRNSSISLWEKLSTKNEKQAKYNGFDTPEVSIGWFWFQKSHISSSSLQLFLTFPLLVSNVPPPQSQIPLLKWKSTVIWCCFVQHLCVKLHQRCCRPRAPTFSEDLSDGEQAPRDHNVLQLCFELLANPKVCNCRQNIFEFVLLTPKMFVCDNFSAVFKDLRVTPTADRL